MSHFIKSIVKSFLIILWDTFGCLLNEISFLFPSVNPSCDMMRDKGFQIDNRRTHMKSLFLISYSKRVIKHPFG